MHWQNGLEKNEYDTAQICLNGHLTNDSARKRPQHNTKHCDKCGTKTITACPDCQVDIRGRYYVGGQSGAMMKTAPAFCHGCGKAYPWTAAKLEAARLLAEESESLSPDEQEQLKSSFDDLVRDTPRTTLAATRFKKLALKAGRGTAEALKEIIVQVASETAKKLLLGP